MTALLFNPLKAKTTFKLQNERFKDLEQLSDWVEENLNEHESEACTIEVDAYAGESDTYTSHFLASVSHCSGVLLLTLWVGDECVARYSPICLTEELRQMDNYDTEQFLYGKIQGIVVANLSEIKSAARKAYDQEREYFSDVDGYNFQWLKSVAQ